MIKFLINLLFIIATIITEISASRFFPPIIAHLNLALMLIIFIELFINHKIALFWAGSIGLAYDAFSLAPFPLFTLSFFLVVFFIKFLSTNLINPEPLYSSRRPINLKSFVNYSLLVLAAVLFFDLVIYFQKILYFLFTDYPVFDKFSWQNLLWQICTNIAFLSTIFLLTNFLLARLKIPLKSDFSDL